ncbi:MAG: Nramp family divalent metal transporter, partial [Candidatus Micrarchaeota archaeon]|nr:Nramp family divalent metal transporter [Candidatus Micrarchaeota archaeon]
EQFPQAAFPLWIAAELVVMATDLAEFLGAALGIYLLFQIPLLLAALIAGVIVFAILAVEKMGFRKFEYTMMGFLIAIFVSYLFEIFIAKPDWGAITYHTLIPMVGASSIYLAVAIVGATVMPHVIYLHSALVQPRVREGYSKKKHLAAARWDVFIAMNAAFFVNAAMLIMAAAVFYAAGVKVNGIEDAHTTLHPLLGGIAPTVFAFALLMSGLSSATVGTMAGQVVMEGFIKRKISIFLRRFITMLPAFIIIGFGFDPLSMLILSQVVLSFGIPFALIPLIIFTSDKKIMGKQVNDKKTVAAAWLVAAIIIGLNVLLLYQSLGGKF